MLFCSKKLNIVYQLHLGPVGLNGGLVRCEAPLVWTAAAQHPLPPWWDSGALCKFRWGREVNQAGSPHGLESGAVGKSLDEEWFWSLARCELLSSQWKLPGMQLWASWGLFPPPLSRDTDPSMASRLASAGGEGLSQLSSASQGAVHTPPAAVSQACPAAQGSEPKQPGQLS